MVQSAAATVDQYLAELPPDRRAALSQVREVIVRNLPKAGRAVAAIPPDAFIQQYEKARLLARKRK